MINSLLVLVAMLATGLMGASAASPQEPQAFLTLTPGTGAGALVVSVDLENTVPVFGAQFDVAYDPLWLDPRPPEPTPRTQQMSLAHNTPRPGRMTILLVSMQGHVIAPGSGPILLMRFAQVQPGASPDHLHVGAVLAGDALGTPLPFVMTGVDAHPGPASPSRFELDQNAPNPFNASTRICYTLAEAASVRLAVFDLRGRLVKVLVLGDQPAGPHTAAWDATDTQGTPQGTGLYLYRLSAAGVQHTRKALLVR